jgi:glycosyltransferase involved in cell wall biosynthesis
MNSSRNLSALEVSAREDFAPLSARPLVYDATHLVTRLDCVATTGIDWVDRIYAQHLVRNARIDCGLHYGLHSPHVLAPRRIGDILQSYAQNLSLAAGDDWRELRAWLTGAEPPERKPATLLAQAAAAALWTKTHAQKARARLSHDRSYRIPDGAIYLNIAQHAFEYHRLFDWLDQRPDLVPVFFVHDMLPLDYPEFFRHGYEQRFRRRAETILRHSRAIVTTSQCTARRIEAEYVSHNQRPVPIHVQPLASPLDLANESMSIDPELAASCYFVVISTIEPRKNHLMLLNIWRSLVSRDGDAPKLVSVGLRGWNSSPTITVFERSTTLRHYVRTASGLSPTALRSLLANARALLMPSYAEGYGLPIVEALSLATPVIASDIPVFHEMAQGCATFLSPLDGAGWRDMIRRFAAENSQTYDDAVQRARAFVKPTWDGYFEGVETFLASL